MPFALLIIGVVLIAAGVRNKQGDLYGLLAADFTGANNFIYWVAAILLIGAVGYLPRMKPVSDGFLILVLLVLVLKRGNPSGAGGGLFSQLTSALNSSTTKAQPAGSTAAQPVAMALPTIQPIGSVQSV